MQKQKDDVSSVPCLLSWRVAICIIGFLAGITLYLLRINMSVAIVCMVKTVVTNTTTGNATSYYVTFDGDGCENDNAGGKTKGNSGEFKWSRQLQGLILSSFFIGYAITQIPGGWLATRFGARWLIFFSVLLTALPTFIIPPAARVSPYFVMAIRIFIGLASGVFFPAFHAIFGKWAPVFERSKMISITYSGTSMGSICTFIFSSLLCKYGYAGGWPSIFYTYGIVGVVWSVAWLFIGYNSPAQHPYINDAERDYIENSIGIKDDTVPPTPWRAILTSPCVWAICACALGDGWVAYTMLTCMPLYMKDVLKLDISQNGLFNALPHLCNVIGTFITSYLADLIREKKILSTTNTRKLMVCSAFFPVAILLIITGYMSCNERNAVIALLCVAMFFHSSTRSGAQPNIVDIAPRFSGILMGISNMFGQISGIFAPIAAGALTGNKTQADWQKVFYLASGFSVFSAVVYVIFGTGEERPWAKIDVDKLPTKTIDCQPKIENMYKPKEIVEKDYTNINSTYL